MSDTKQTVRKVLKKIFEEQNISPRDVEVVPTSSDGANYTTELFYVNVTLPQQDLKLFAKVACIGDAIRGMVNASWLYATEIFVYTQIAKIYNAIERKNNVPEEDRFVFPKFYGYDPEDGKETVVMENLLEAGYKLHDRLKAMDWEHMAVGLESLAKFHALSFAFEKYYPEEFGEITKNMSYGMIRLAEAKEINDGNNNMWKSMVDSALEVLDVELRDRVRRFAMNHRLVDKLEKPLGKPVIVHGDCKMPNFMFRRQDDRLQAIVVDYQTTHAGCPASDLMYYIFLGTDEEFRREHYERLLDHYHSSLEQALKRLAVDPSVYTREKLDSDMKELLPYAVLLGVVVLPVVTVESNAAPKVEGDADVNNFIMKPNELYAKRFSGIVNDCVRWGAI
ncbi:uncharacterized protein LOC112044812 isoform X2 [Bicyclus anynana]|uniref:Uncharacterized protein LOC112044812 isoform X2 n=1 Tax=Bicyclus anynana TaxID=110368 RepID=A0ABM3LX61_BICAN|nr:uncharacterized protein LOC112044812 isoform X2 [Bicyclus anynana]